MTPEDFELIAAAIADAWGNDGIDYGYTDGWADGVNAAAHALADALHTTNPAFDRERFLKACGVTT